MYAYRQDGFKGLSRKTTEVEIKYTVTGIGVMDKRCESVFANIESSITSDLHYRLLMLQFRTIPSWKS
jgi:hypothetical protein